MIRNTKHRHYLNIAVELATQGTCLRRNYGAIIVKGDVVISTGYTGAPRGTPNCIDIMECERDRLGVPSGERYELCRSVHAEMNAVIHGSYFKMNDATMYVGGIDRNTDDGEYLIINSGNPCLLCRKVIINARINEVIGFIEIGDDTDEVMAGCTVLETHEDEGLIITSRNPKDWKI